MSYFFKNVMPVSVRNSIILPILHETSYPQSIVLHGCLASTFW